MRCPYDHGLMVTHWAGCGTATKSLNIAIPDEKHPSALKIPFHYS